MNSVYKFSVDGSLYKVNLKKLVMIGNIKVDDSYYDNTKNSIEIYCKTHSFEVVVWGLHNDYFLKKEKEKLVKAWKEYNNENNEK